jgi:hypothetical protein
MTFDIEEYFRVMKASFLEKRNVMVFVVGNVRAGMSYNCLALAKKLNGVKEDFPVIEKKSKGFGKEIEKEIESKKKSSRSSF